jgi:hypothetical protein
MLAGLYSQEYSWYSFLLDAKVVPRARVQLEGLSELKNQMTSGIKHVIFQLVP